MIKYATRRLIDAVWTVGYVEAEGGVVIVSYDRENPIGYKNEGTLPTATLKEDGDRTVVSLILYPKTRISLGVWPGGDIEPGHHGTAHKVLNPRHVFSYSKKNTPSTPLDILMSKCDAITQKG